MPVARKRRTFALDFTRLNVITNNYIFMKTKKLLLTLALLLGVVGGANYVKADVVKVTLDQLTAGYGSTSDWLTIANGISYPISVSDGTLFGSDGGTQTTNADVKDYDYLYVTVTEFTANKAVRIFFWDKSQNKRLDYYLKPEADKETANFETASDITGNGTYCVKVPDGARLQGAKPAWGSSADVSFKFSEIYLTERATPYVELEPYTLVYSEGSANIPISESHIRTTGGVSINYSTGVVTSTGSGKLIIYLNNEDLVGATRYVADVTDENETKLEPTLEVADAVNGEVGGIYSSRYNWNIAGDASRNTRIGSVTALRYNFSRTGSMTINSLSIIANELIAGTTEKNLTDMTYRIWGLPANQVSNYTGVDSYITDNIDGESHGGLLYGHENNSDAYKYVDLTNCKKIIFTGLSSNGAIRLFYNWSGTDADKPIEVINDFPTTSGTYTFDIEAFKKTKGISFFHLNGIKTNWGNATFSSVKVVEYTNVISGSGINRAKNYLSNPYITSIDATGITAATALTLANPNCLIVANAGKVTNDNNVIVSGACDNFVLADNKPFKAPADFTATDASYDRSIAAATTTTVCLPFALTQDECDAIGTFYTLTGISGDYLQFAEVTSGGAAAKTPYLVVTPAGEAKTFADMKDKAVAAGAALTQSGTNAYFLGTLEATAVKSTGDYTYYALNNGEFVKAGSDKGFVLPAFRGYIKIADGYVPAARLGISFINDDVTGIKSVANSQEKKSGSQYFDLQGRRVSKPVKGLYVVNGKKMVIK